MWYRNLSLFKGDDRKRCKGFEQLAGAKQEIGIAWPAKAFVAAREGLVDQHSTRRESAGNRREQRTVQVIGNDDSIIVMAELRTVIGLEVDPAHSGKYKIMWQRCSGAKTTHASTYGTYNATSGSNMTGMGPAGRQAIAPTTGATMFVEVYYEYQPLVKTSLSPTTNFTEIASMMVRDTRDLTQVYNTEHATLSSC